MQALRTFINNSFLHISVSGLCFLERTGKHGEKCKRSERLFVGCASTA